MQARFVEKVPGGGGATSFIFAPSETLTWAAGQSVRLEIPGVYGPEEHRFTLSAPPSRHYLQITTRPSESTYKQALFELQVGVPVQAYDIRGDFVWGDGVMPRVFAASGIGITPFIAMLEQRAYEAQPLTATLIYAFRKNEGVFLETLDQLAAVYPEFQLHLLEGVRLQAEMLHSLISALAKNTIYLSGPTAMVDDLASDLSKDYDVPEAHLKKDWFTGPLGRDD